MHITIGIAGGSASGKTTLAKMIIDALGNGDSNIRCLYESLSYSTLIDIIQRHQHWKHYKMMIMIIIILMMKMLIMMGMMMIVIMRKIMIVIIFL